MYKKEKHEFRFEAPAANSVAVAGTFNRWQPEETLMKRRRNGVWTVHLDLPAGCHEYRFVVDGQWVADFDAPESVPNPFGGVNSVVVLNGARR